MTQLRYILEDLWVSNKLPQSSIVESLNSSEAVREILAFISSATKEFTDVTAENNTDILRIELEKNKSGNENKTITVEQIRSLQDDLNSTAGISPYKFAVIADSDAMNINASNCLLKILEDTPKNSFIFLVAKSKASLLPTIRSRCISIFNDKAIEKNHPISFDKEIYIILNPEVRFEDKIIILDKLASDKNLKIEELASSIIASIAKILRHNQLDCPELEAIKKYVEKQKISFNDLLDFSKDSSFLLNSAVNSFLDFRQILLLLISKFALL